MFSYPNKKCVGNNFLWMNVGLDIVFNLHIARHIDQYLLSFEGMFKENRNLIERGNIFFPPVFTILRKKYFN